MVNNSPDIRYENFKKIFQILLKHAPISRRNIQKLTGLSWGTVSMFTNELINHGFITEVPAVSDQLGRIPKNLDVNRKSNFILTVDINISGITFLVASLNGKQLYTEIHTLNDNSKEYILEFIQQKIQVILRQYPAVIAIGISMQGLLDTRNGISLFSPYFQNWVNIPIQEIIHSYTNLPVFVFHDPDCLMKNELHSNKIFTENTQNCIIIRLDNGIGMSILINGQIYTGASGLAAELGHTTIQPNGAPCPCGKNGCLEAYCSGKGLLSRFVEISITNHYDKYTLKDIINKANNNDKRAVHVFENMGYYLGIAIANLINLFEPEIILFTGALTEQKHLFAPALEKQIKQAYHSDSYNTKILYNEFEPIAPCVGAVHFTVEKIMPNLLQF